MLGSPAALRRSPSPFALAAPTVWPRVVAAFEAPWVAYPLLLLLQLKVVWGVWAYQDVPCGDTVAYFTHAWQWFRGFGTDVAWSPLYTSFYGSFLFLDADPVRATFAHRVVIVLAAATLVLAVLRQLLPAGVAWLCAAWWAALPIAFNTLYEVHLFGALPVLAGWLLLLTATGPWRRAAALGVFAAATVLVRNELSVPTAVLGLVLAATEWRHLRAGRTRAAGTALAYAAALGAAAGLCAAAYAASCEKYPKLATHLKEKHTLNMAQVYAFGHQQRHPEWDLSPWTQCHGLMEETFGGRDLTLREMIAANPRAVAEHFAWNASLTPSGLQLLLFNRASGSVSPDYDGTVAARLNSPLAAALTVALLAVWAAGGAALWRDRRAWWRSWLSVRWLGWAAVLAVATVVPLVVVTQRPRPSYLFAFGVSLIALTGMCVHAAATRWHLADGLRRLAPLLAVALVLIVPRHFVQGKHRTQPVAAAVTRLLPYRDAVAAPGVVTVVPDRTSVGWYVHPEARFVTDRELLPEFGEVAAAARPGEPFAALLARRGVDYLYLDETALGWMAGKRCDGLDPYLDGRSTPECDLLGIGNAPGDRWRLYRRAR
ncbi:hypothetical protein [Gemmata sp.]|uniref:hypothetical protein n=1 Tax=Gemmata sp. TaxID=1914242 RepID=UPI003F6FDEC8